LNRIDSYFAPGTTGGLQASTTAAIANGTFLFDPPSGSLHPGMSNFGETEPSNERAAGGNRWAGASADIDRGNPATGHISHVGHIGYIGLTPLPRARY
jgi:hypothetical protein